MAERERFEPATHIAEVDESVVGNAPVGKNRRERREGVQTLFLCRALGIGSHEGRNEDVGRCFGYRAYSRVEGEACMRIVGHEASRRIYGTCILSLDTCPHLGYVGNEVSESLRIVAVVGLG